jgi:hypothetical protein
MGFGALPALTACAEDPLPLPAYEDMGLHRECACVTRGDCVSVDPDRARG